MSSRTSVKTSHYGGGVVEVRLCRPEVRNAVNRETAEALYRAFVEFEVDPVQKVAVLSGEGGHFCAGADLSALRAEASSGNRLNNDMSLAGPMGPTRLRLTKPVIAAVSGYAVAGGLELALWCDLRVADESAVFGVFCRRFGVPLIDGGTQRLPRLIGRSRALDMILTGRAVDAAEAFTMGLVNRLVTIGEAREAALELAREVGTLPQNCMRSDRGCVLDGEGMEFDAAMAMEFARGERLCREREMQDGIAQFGKGGGRHGEAVESLESPEGT